MVHCHIKIQQYKEQGDQQQASAEVQKRKLVQVKQPQQKQKQPQQKQFIRCRQKSLQVLILAAVPNY